MTGLSTAYALEQQGWHDYVVLESKNQAGGLCASTQQNGYRFDFGGHLLHLHTKTGKHLVQTLLKNNLKKHNRHAFIYTNGMQVPYPFQQNLWALHDELKSLCAEELKRGLPLSNIPPAHFEEWCLRQFGYVLYEIFFRPYNEKLWGRPLHELSYDWCNPFVPAPSSKEIWQSLRTKPRAKQGYNATFYYPKQGGIGALIDALIQQVPNIRLGTPATRIDLAHKRVWTPQAVYCFEHLVNTIALPNFVQLLDNEPTLKQAAALLQAQPVSVYHVAIARQVPHFSWIYFPDPAQPFYRVGLQSGFAPDAVPAKDISLFYVEISGNCPQTPVTEQLIWAGLHQKGLVPLEDIKLFSTWQHIPQAYVIFNKQRAQAVPFLLSELEKRHVFCAGRYGKWEYSFMERSLVEGQQLAQKLAKLV